MSASTEFLVVGSGLTGATIARQLHDAGRRVLVIDRRPHLGGNVHDYVHPSGIRVNTYGPHYFRTSSERIWSYVRRFGDFHPYRAQVKSIVGGRLESWPIAASYLDRVVGPDWSPSFSGQPANFEEASLAIMPRQIYEAFVKGYTEKQWGVPADCLSPALVRRFAVRGDDNPDLTPRHRHQGIPVAGYTAMMTAMLERVPTRTGVDYLQHRDGFGAPGHVVYTGPIDELFGYDIGRLDYRGQRRETFHLPDVDDYQLHGQVNNPDPGAGLHIRTLEWKHMMPPAEARQIRGTVITRETTISPRDADDYEYPVPDARNTALYARYKARARAIPSLTVCGRLGEYRYYDMDQAIGRAMILARRLLQEVDDGAG